MSASSSAAWRAEDRHERRARRRQAAERAQWQAFIGLHAGISPLNLAAFILHTASSIVFLVFLNATQPFIIAQLGESKRQGSISGNLIFADELLSMLLALFWGSLADVTGTRSVAVVGYGFIACALYAYTLVRSAYPGLLFTRLLFAIGGSAVTSMLTGILNSYAAVKQAEEAPHEDAEANDESSYLLRRPTRRSSKLLHGRLAALAGLTTGCGALFAVFILLRLPTQLAKWHENAMLYYKQDEDDNLRQGTREAFYMVAGLALIVAGILAFGLKMDAPSRPTPNEPARNPIERPIEPSTAREARRQRLKNRMTTTSGTRAPSSDRWSTFALGVRQLVRGIFRGFQLAKGNSTLSLAYLGSALARASTIATTVFIPLLVTRFFYSSGRCTDLPSANMPPEELKKLCRQAFTVASILSGVAQLTALLAAPLIGLLCDAQSPAKALLSSSLIATVAYAIMATALPHDGDPRGPLAVVAAVGMGLGQIGAIVASLALCANAKSEVKSTIDGDEDEASTSARSNSGAIAGAYSAVGGLSILFISSLGGRLSDTYAPAAFSLMSLLAALTTVISAFVVIRTRSSARST